VYISFSGGIVKVLNTKTWTEVDSLKCESGINEMAVSPDGKFLAAFSGKNIEVWDLKSFKRKWKLEGHDQGGYGIGFSPDSRYVISGSYDQTFKIWDLSNGMCTLTYHGFEDVVYSCKILSDKEIFVGSSQGKIWYYKF
jgi:WD40 repeat protein